MAKQNYSYAELFKSWAKMLGLKYHIQWSKSSFGPALEISAIVENAIFQSTLAVCEEGKIPYVDQLRRYKQGATEADIEELSRQMLESTFHENHYIMSTKCGCTWHKPDGTIEKIPQTVIKDLPRCVDELLIRLDLT